MKDGNSLRNEISQLMPGAEVKLTYIRNGKEDTVGVKLAELKARPEGEGRDNENDGPAEGTTFGMTVEPLTRETARQLDVDATTGVVVTRVQPGSNAADAGLRAGDVIEEVDRQPVQSSDALRDASVERLGAGAPAGSPRRDDVVRHTPARSIAVTPPTGGVARRRPFHIDGVAEATPFSPAPTRPFSPPHIRSPILNTTAARQIRIGAP